MSVPSNFTNATMSQSPPLYHKTIWAASSQMALLALSAYLAFPFSIWLSPLLVSSIAGDWEEDLTHLLQGEILSNTPLPPRSIQAKPAVSVSSWKPLYCPGFSSISIPFTELKGHQTHHSSCHSGQESTSGLRLGRSGGFFTSVSLSVSPALRKP